MWGVISWLTLTCEYPILLRVFGRAHRDSTIQPWHVFVSYQVVNIFSFFFNCYGRTLPLLGQITLWTSLVSFFVILVVVPAKAPTHQNARFVFAHFVNGTGWSQNGIGRLRSHPLRQALD